MLIKRFMEGYFQNRLTGSHLGDILSCFNTYNLLRILRQKTKKTSGDEVS